MTYTLYAAPGACSRVPMIVLEEAGARYEIELVRFMKGAHKSPDYLALNPAGKVPVLVTPEGPISENVAIAWYLARQFPGLLPKSRTDYEATRLLTDLSFCSSNLHPIVTRMRMPMFMVDGQDAQVSVRAMASEAMMPHARVINARVGNGSWWYGAQWSIVDAYLYWVWFRITGVGFPGAEFPNWAAHAQRMEQRDAVRRALAREAELQDQLETEGLAPPMR